MCNLGYNGDCCCECKNQIELYKHPNNSNVLLERSVSRKQLSL